ncbi:MAG: hypothetical protein ACLFPL_00535 [Candidatus Nanoarchaeia archaeon]
MRDLRDSIQLFDSTTPDNFLQIPIATSYTQTQNGIYIQEQELILPDMFAPLGSLVDETGEVRQEYNKELIERLYRQIKGGVRISIETILEKEELDVNFLKERCSQIVIKPQYPQKGRYVAYGVEFLE